MSENQTAFLFPGQGSQYPGIGSDLYQAHAVVRETYEQASDTLGYDIARLSFEDPDGEIGLTRYTQPVLLTHSIACLRALESLCPGKVTATVAAGHSLGEYSALVTAGSLTFETALGLVKTRGELMGEFGEGEMEALMVDLESAAALAGAHYCGIAACNLPDQIVVGGRPEDLDALISDMAVKFPRKRSTRLKTEGAFHTFYMIEAARRYRETLAAASFQSPSMTIMSNCSGSAHDPNPDAIRSQLFMQLFNPVMWHRNLVAVGQAGATRLIEFGGGLGKGETPAEKRPNLEGIVRKTFRGDEDAPEYLPVINCETLESTAAVLNA